MLTRCDAASVTSAVSGSPSESEEFTGVLLLTEIKQHTSAKPAHLFVCTNAEPTTHLACCSPSILQDSGTNSTGSAAM